MTVAQETSAMTVIAGALDKVSDEEGRHRVLRWAVDAYKMPSGGKSGSNAAGRERVDVKDAEYEDVSHFLERVNATSTANRVLAVCYYHQYILGETDWQSQFINKDLKDIGHGVSNITDALDGLIERSPSLVRQVKKSGTSRQARKRYSVTVEGKKAIENMLAGQPGE